jgi:hypothetical protein
MVNVPKRLVGKRSSDELATSQTELLFEMGGENIKNRSQGLALSQIVTNKWFFNAQAT